MAKERFDLKAFAGRLRYALDRAGLTQADLATETGIHKDTINDWATGKTEAEAAHEVNLRAAAVALGVSTDWLRHGGATPRIRRREPSNRLAVAPGPFADAEGRKRLRDTYTGAIKELMEVAGPEGHLDVVAAQRLVSALFEVALEALKATRQRESGADESAG